MERGVALVIVLVLLAILTLLAMGSVGTAVAELTMAGNEQYRALASDAASSGVELAMEQMRSVSLPPTRSPITAGSATIRYVGTDPALPQSSVGKLLGHHYVIESEGSSMRGAVDRQRQGALTVAPATGGDTFARIGTGLTEGGGP